MLAVAPHVWRWISAKQTKWCRHSIGFCSYLEKRRFIFVTKTLQKECLCHKPKSCKVYHAYSWSSLCLLLINQSSNTLYTYKLYVLHMNLSSGRKIKEPTRFARTKRTFLYNWWSYICQYLQPYFPEHCYLKVNTSML